MTLDSLFEEAASRGLHLTNLFQTREGDSWCVRLCVIGKDIDSDHVEVEAPTPSAALRAALDRSSVGRKPRLQLVRSAPADIFG